MRRSKNMCWRLAHLCAAALHKKQQRVESASSKGSIARRRVGLRGREERPGCRPCDRHVRPRSQQPNHLIGNPQSVTIPHANVQTRSMQKGKRPFKSNAVIKASADSRAVDQMKRAVCVTQCATNHTARASVLAVVLLHIDLQHKYLLP